MRYDVFTQHMRQTNCHCSRFAIHRTPLHHGSSPGELKAEPYIESVSIAITQQRPHSVKPIMFLVRLLDLFFKHDEVKFERFNPTLH